MTTDLLILTDNPTGNTGLGRVGRQIANRIHQHMPDVFRVGIAGIGGGENILPYPVYPMEMKYGDQFPYAWREHCRDGEGILLTITNAVWLEWLTNPESLPLCDLREFGMRAKMKKWAYAPVDAESAGGKLPPREAKILAKFDRVLAYTKFGADLIEKSIRPFAEWQVPWKKDPIPHLPHGTDSAVFHPLSREESRKSQFGPRVLKRQVSLDMNTLILGIVATNTARKDWPLAYRTIAELRARGVDVGVWAHTNRVSGYWDLVEMAESFGVRDCIQFTATSLSDQDMAWGYAACDVILGIGSGEGWGMPLSEALACGVPVVTGDYSGVTEFVPAAYRVAPWGWHDEGLFVCKRPVYRAGDWADRIIWAKGTNVRLDSKFTWDECWPAWERWLKGGLS